MAGKTEYEAFVNFRRPLQEDLACVNKDAHVWTLGTDGFSAYPNRHALTPNRPEPVKLPAGNRTLYLISQINYRIVKAEGEQGPWKVETLAYYHSLEDENGREIVAYHWHPEGLGHYTKPHLHIGAGIGDNLYDDRVTKYHFPTNRVSLEDVLLLAICEFGVKPQRKNALAILRQNREAFETWRTWS